MIKNVAIGKVELRPTSFLPPLLQPMVACAASGAPLEPVLASICSQLGFDSFMFGMSVSPHVTHESQVFAFTTLPVEWVMRYDACDYVEVDPRVLKTYDNRIPLLWNTEGERGVSEATDAFLSDAASHGISSGLAYEVNDSEYRGVMALNSAKPELDAQRRAKIAQNLGDIMLLGAYFQEILRRSVLEQGTISVARNAPLSARQRQCLEMAARGLTNDDIAFKLNISPRTAQFHFDSIRAKLNAANRQEAVAKAIKSGVIRP